MTDPAPIHRAQIEDEHVDAQINRINELTRVGRTNWFGLLAYLAFATVTVLGVDDADFFLDTRQTTLPLVGVSIPTLSFFFFAPILGTALYVHLHLHIRKLADAVSAPEACPKHDNVCLENYLNSWSLVDLMLKMRGDECVVSRPLDWAVHWLAITLVWWAAPVVLLLFWFCSWPAHSALLTVMIASLTGCCGWAATISWLNVRHLRHRKGAKELGGWSRRFSVLGVTLVLIVFGMVKTEIGRIATLQFPESFVGRSPEENRWQVIERFLSGLSLTDLKGLQATSVPPDQRDYSTEWHRFRLDWCEINGGTLRNASCLEHFQDREADFHADWQEYRRVQFGFLGPPNLRAEDLRNAQLQRAQLQGATLRDARLEGASLVRTNLQSAYARGASFQRADLRAALLQDANLLGSNFRRANLLRAQLQGANLREADLSGAYLSEIVLSEFTDLDNASLNGAAIRSIDDATLALLTDHWDDIILFAETLPDGAPAHWVQTDDDFTNDDFLTQWHTWAASLDPPVTIAPDYDR